MKKILTFLSAPYLMIVLLILLAASMGIATFVENDFGTNAAKALYYNSWWFEALFVLLAVNLLLNIVKPYMYSKGKLAVLLFHVSFFIIILGAALTRYVGCEGLMHIREGETADRFLSSGSYISGSVEKNGEVVLFEQEVFMSEKSKGCFSEKVSVGGDDIQIKSVDYISQTTYVATEGAGGKPYVSIVYSDLQGGRRNVGLFWGDKVSVDDYVIAFGEDTVADFHIYPEGDSLMFCSTHSVFTTDMASQQEKEIGVGVSHQFVPKKLYKTEGIFIVQTHYMTSAILQPVPVSEGENGSYEESVILNVAVDDSVKTLVLQGNIGALGETNSIEVDGCKITASYGSKILNIPFKIMLNDFQLDRYPGSESPSSFASEVTLYDAERGVKADFRIFMNNILNYKGYRFYQSSYDKDELGTVLSVNNDYWGTTITYVGYFLMSISMLLSLIASKSRFVHLSKVVKEVGNQKKSLVLLGLFFMSICAYSQSVDEAVKVSETQAEKFGELWVQDNGGRLKPLNSMNGEVLRKLVKHNTFKGYSADRVVLSMLAYPELWQKVPMITVKAESIKRIVGNRDKKASFADFFTSSGVYKLSKEVNDAYRTKPSYRTKEQNDLIKIDEQVNVLYMAKTGQLLKIFPVPGEEGAAWLQPGQYSERIEGGDSLFVRNVFGIYLKSLIEGKDQEALKYLDAINKYQKKYGADIIPGNKVKSLEIFYNRSNLFLMLAPVLFVLGLLLVVIQFAYLFVPKKSPGMVNVIGFWVLFLGFLAYSGGLALRWYISGHAPWSNSYESMLYIGWSMLLAGLIFSGRSAIALSVAALFSGIVLLVSHLSWMNPEITNLVPVLKSYWLTIHVAVIVASYGFLGLGALMAFFNLILIGVQKTGDKKIELTIKELSAIVEMGLTVGLYLMTIGSFLGGIWANESWGRYWGWDPKETWSLVTIVVYAVILHLRFVPSLRSLVIFNAVSVVGFFSVLMTYLGVNYYLAGMHSYAKGDPVPVPDFVYYVIVTIVVVVGYAFYNHDKTRKTSLG
ncbi:cytochrome c biogenesis protein [Plebeiibacterium marinum]|uniref:Cytochrome c biogenesis protein CcsA n=1 Tax=Plebeiibacterium marinum TaxID=2992111 RepID=A0AAE3SJL5_9BACT|nr:cytochrome c biogenesis protein CcsA [Plebeiobacterium marinum]MCW3805865.1 cytochrome c biogenesis protein CcsA [Plebeiobacterium marinum]